MDILDRFFTFDHKPLKSITQNFIFETTRIREKETREITFMFLLKYL
jgi:hypothetical protein